MKISSQTPVKEHISFKKIIDKIMNQRYSWIRPIISWSSLSWTYSQISLNYDSNIVLLRVRPKKRILKNCLIILLKIIKKCRLIKTIQGNLSGNVLENNQILQKQIFIRQTLHRCSLLSKVFQERQFLWFFDNTFCKKLKTKFYWITYCEKNQSQERVLLFLE